MIKPGCVRHLAHSLFLFFFVALATGLHAAEPVRDFDVVPSICPGVYAAAQLVSFKIPPNSRLLVGIDGAPPSENTAPVLFSVPEGSVHEFLVVTELHSLEPEGKPVAYARFSWTIDRKAPDVPAFSEKAVEGGNTVTLGLSEPGTIFWKMYHPLYNASDSGSLVPGESVFVPVGAILCAWGVDTAGNRGPAGTFSRSVSSGNEFPCRIVSPASGVWANPQMLVIERGAGVTVSYTIDSSDPAASGIPYSGPVLLSDTSINAVRILAIDASGKHYTEQVHFAVVPPSAFPAGTTPVPELPADGSLVKTGEFMELHMPTGFTCCAGNAVLPDSGESQLALTSVRGIHSFFPVTVTDGSSQWRWTLSGGSSETAVQADSAPAKISTDPAIPHIAIHDWYFVEIAFSSPVYVSLDGGSWQELRAPFFVDRSTGHELRWYSGSWKSGELQKIDLPAKPVLSGMPSTGLTANPVFMTAPGSPYTLQYEGGYYEPDAPNASSPELASGLLVEIPKGTESRFVFRFRALYEGLVHGELETSFDIDRKVPRTPNAGIPDALVYSRVPVTVRPSGEDSVHVSITPALYTQKDSTYILDGDPKHSVDYTITLFAVDRAGNKSRVSTRKLTVDINALYVDASGPSVTSGARDGTPHSPYVSLDDALDAVRGSGDWRIYVQGGTILSNPHIIRNSLSIFGSGGSVSAGAGSSLTVVRSALELHNVAILRIKDDQSATRPADRLPENAAPFLIFENAHFTIENSTVLASASRSGTLIRARNSSLSLLNSKVAFASDDYALLLDADHCDLSVTGCSLASQARDSSCVELAASTASFNESTISVSAVSACRAVEARESSLSLRDLSLIRNVLPGEAEKRLSASPDGTSNRDTALMIDLKSRIIAEKNVTATGFWRVRDSGNAR